MTCSACDPARNEPESNRCDGSDDHGYFCCHCGVKLRPVAAWYLHDIRSMTVPIMAFRMFGRRSLKCP